MIKLKETCGLDESSPYRKGDCPLFYKMSVVIKLHDVSKPYIKI